jgi:Family of unknown function (DUF6163)
MRARILRRLENEPESRRMVLAPRGLTGNRMPDEGDPRTSMTSVAPMSSGPSASPDDLWTIRLVLFLRVMAVVSLVKGLYHWAQITGFVGTEDDLFEAQSLAWQTATVYLAVIELVAAVGLWLATPWGAVLWLTTVVSIAVIELMFPSIYGGGIIMVTIEIALLFVYLGLAWMAARERPP